MSDKKTKPRPGYRAWEAGKYQRTASAWGVGQDYVNNDIRNQIKDLRRRSIDQAQNNPYARYYIKLCVSNVIGHGGFKFRSTATDLVGNPDRDARRIVENGFADWSKRGNCDVTGQHSFRDMCALVLQSAVIYGQGLARIVDFDNDYGIALQAIDPELLDVELNKSPVNGGTFIAMGVEKDLWGRPLRYHFKDSVRVYGQRGGQAERPTIDARQILDFSLSEWVGQPAGVPWMATSLGRMYQSGKYEDAEAVAARHGAERIGHYTKSLDAVGPSGTLADEEQDLESEFIQEAQKGEFGILPPGWGFDAYSPGHPNAVYPAFMKQGLQGISAGLCTSYPTLSNDLSGVNYTSIRYGSLTEKDIWMMIQNDFIESVCQPANSAWADSSILRNAFDDRVTLAQAKQARFQGRRWRYVDPVKDLTADLMAVQSGVKSLSEVIRGLGGEPEEVWDELKTDLARLDELGLRLPDLSAALISAVNATETSGNENDG